MSGDRRKEIVRHLSEDDLDTETGRPLDAYSYRLRDLETDAEFSLAVRHRDLVPADNQ